MAVSSGGFQCDGELFADPQLDACARNGCCFEMGVCLADPLLCFDPDTGSLMSSPDGAALYSCLVNTGCLESAGFICDSGLRFEQPDLETAELARCLSERCCEEFNACTSGGDDATACVECMNGETEEDDLCRPALDCGAQCGFVLDDG